MGDDAARLRGARLWGYWRGAAASLIAAQIHAQARVTAGGGFFIATNPHRSRCSTRRLATNSDISSSALWTRLRPWKPKAKARVLATSSAVAGVRRSGASDIRGQRSRAVRTKKRRLRAVSVNALGAGTGHQGDLHRLRGLGGPTVRKGELNAPNSSTRPNGGSVLQFEGRAAGETRQQVHNDTVRQCRNDCIMTLTGLAALATIFRTALEK